jgi:hypothetical protein
LGREDNASARELGCPDRPGACTAGALLSPGLAAAAGDEASALRRLRSGSSGVQLGANRLVHEMRLEVGAEDAFVERRLIRRLAADA